MLFSGLWKLAAMTGVVGVGLFAVYQAQKGMDKGIASAASPDSAGDDQTTASPGGDVPADKPQSTAVGEPDPFDRLSVESNSPKESIPIQRTIGAPRQPSSPDDDWASGETRWPPL